jgi:hypothetical protein
MAKEEVFTLDMTGAGPLNTEIPYMFTLLDLTPGQSAKENPMVTGQFRIEAPDKFAGRRFTQAFSMLPTALFGLYGLLKGLGESDDSLNTAEFKFKPANYVGRQGTVWFRTQESEQFGSRSVPRKWGSVEDYKEPEVY